MKNKEIRALLKKKSVTAITSHMDKNSAISVLSHIVLLARTIISNDITDKDTYNILMPTPHSLASIDRFKWFGMLGLFLDREIELNIYVSGTEDLKPVASPYSSLLGNVPAVNVHACDTPPCDVNFDITLVCHNDSTAVLAESIKLANSKINLMMYWSETDWAVNAEVLKAYGIELSDPAYNEHSISSTVESGSGWCQTYSEVTAINHIEAPDREELITAEWLAAMYEHSSNIGHSNPYVMPTSGIKDLKIKNALNQDFIYVIDNIICNVKNGFLFTYKKNEIKLVASTHELAKPPHKKASFLDKFIWAQQIKCLYHLRENEKDQVNKKTVAAIKAYAEVIKGPIKNILKGILAEMDLQPEEAFSHYKNATKDFPAEAFYRMAGVRSEQNETEEAIELWEVSSSHGSAFGAYNAYVLSCESSYPNHTANDHYKLLSMSAETGFEPAQAALAEICYGLGKVRECSEWLKASALNGNTDSAHNHVLILQQLLAISAATSSEIKMAQRTLRKLDADRKRFSAQGKA
jgi:hypothetical protein